MARGKPPTLDDYQNIMWCKGHDFNTQCVQEYLEPETGRALLTNIRPRIARKKLFPGVPVVMLVQAPEPSGVKIVGILPAHDGHAAIKIANSTDRLVNLECWKVLDRKTVHNCSLSGEVPPGSELVVSLADFTFNVDGGDVFLFSAKGLCHTVSYTEEQARSGEWVEVG
jgi:hypothetical protein